MVVVPQTQTPPEPLHRSHSHSPTFPTPSTIKHHQKQKHLDVSHQQARKHQKVEQLQKHVVEESEDSEIEDELPAQQLPQQETPAGKSKPPAQTLFANSDSEDDDDEALDDDFDDEHIEKLRDDEPIHAEPEVNDVDEFDGNGSSLDDDSDTAHDDGPLSPGSHTELPIERAARLQVVRDAADAEASAAELQMNVTSAAASIQLPQELDTSGQLDAAALRSRMQDIVSVLNDFRRQRKEGRSRSEYLAQFLADATALYNYLPELIEKFSEMFNPSELVEFLEANEQPRPITLRTNTLKVRRRDLIGNLRSRGANVDSIADWTKVGLKVFDTQVPIGATPEYLAGYYMLQSASSMLPVMALNPGVNEKVVDMCAAPGGKSTHLSACMKNTGVLYANDSNERRLPSLVYNLHRMGCTNTVVSHMDGRHLPKYIGNDVDKVLLDAPCTGLGVISRDPSIKLSKNLIDLQTCSHLQKELILAAIDMLKPEGMLVYSTCSVTIEENEDVVAYALNKRHVQLVNTDLTFGVDGFVRCREKRYVPEMKICKRYYPHVHNMDGFFVAKLRKVKHGERIANIDPQDSKPQSALEHEQHEDDYKAIEEHSDTEQVLDDVDASSVSDSGSDSESQSPTSESNAEVQHTPVQPTTKSTPLSAAGKQRSSLPTAPVLNYNKYSKKHHQPRL